MAKNPKETETELAEIEEIFNMVTRCNELINESVINVDTYSTDKLGYESTFHTIFHMLFQNGFITKTPKGEIEIAQIFSKEIEPALELFE